MTKITALSSLFALVAAVGGTALLKAQDVSEIKLTADKDIDSALGSLGPLPPVWGDRSQLIRLFRNLAENAIQASPAGAQVRFEGGVAASGRGNEVFVKVVDQGDGIPAEHHARLFDPFFTTRTMGTGLGLAIVKRIVDQHQGRISFDTGPGQGTTFTVVLPTQPDHLG